MRGLALVLLGLAAPAVAQSGGDAYIQQTTAALGSTPSQAFGPTERDEIEAAVAWFTPLGSRTNAVIFNQSGEGNAIVAQQIGSGNGAVLSQFGSGNLTELLQNGRSNLYTATLTGDDNIVRANQDGSDNMYGLVLSGSGTEHTVDQIGSANTATQVVAPGMRPVDIEQRGNGLEVLVERF